jgi:colanic acid/amylovoran biosynthesis glycosyltransferase
VLAFPRLSETFIVTKVLKLLDAGFDVRVFSLTESSDWDSFAVLAGRDDVRARVHVGPPLATTPRALTTGSAEIARAAANHPIAFGRYVAHTWRKRRENHSGFWKSLYVRIRFIGHDLDILHIEFDAQGMGFADLKEFLGCRMLYSARGTFQHFVDDAAEACAYLFRYVDGYHFISKFVDANTHRLGLPADVPTWRIEPAIDLTLFRPPPRRLREPGAPVRLISVGRLAWAKGYEFALEAVARARAAGVIVDYTIYGQGPYAESISFAIAQLGLSDCARIGGALAREAMPRVYAGADIMIHAALEEGFCNAVIEAQAMELPVVTSDRGGLPENVEDGVTGFVVPARDAPAMAARIVELARDPELRQRLGEAGRARALARFDLDRQAEAFVRLYEELAALPKRAVQTTTAAAGFPTRS